MKKIPTLFLRDPGNLRYVTREVHPECRWVNLGRGTPTRKYDGTCVMYDGLRWWARREVRPDKRSPDGFLLIETDKVTGRSVGWEPAERSSFLRYLVEATQRVDEGLDEDDGPWQPGTFELVGPKINGNPERREAHTLIRHSLAERLVDVPRNYDDLAVYLAGFDGEGIVWHHDDGRMAKLKRRDLPNTSIKEFL